jgi:hypothetical protein
MSKKEKAEQAINILLELYKEDISLQKDEFRDVNIILGECEIDGKLHRLHLHIEEHNGPSYIGKNIN